MGEWDSDSDRELSGSILTGGSRQDGLGVAKQRPLIKESVDVKSPRRCCRMSSRAEDSSGATIFREKGRYLNTVRETREEGLYINLFLFPFGNGIMVNIVLLIFCFCSYKSKLLESISPEGTHLSDVGLTTIHSLQACPTQIGRSFSNHKMSQSTTTRMSESLTI